ncbi:MAG: glycosyltransferase [Deltaproteobacteria bacterium]|nr:glycosyltransferase [Deltaproteobacteria bacterium]
MADTERISVIIPARDEAAYLPGCVEAIRKSHTGLSIPLEIVVVINRCTDNTEEIALSLGCRVVHDDSKNLAEIRNCGVKAATGEYIVTIDADSKMSKNMLPKIVAALRSPTVVGGGVMMFPERYSVGIVLTYIMLVPIALRYGIAGGVFFCRKQDFDDIGGFDPEYFSAEDIDFARRLKAHGKSRSQRFKILLTSHIVTSCRKFDKFGDWYFLLHPLKFVRALKGRDRELADKVWYDFPH